MSVQPSDLYELLRGVRTDLDAARGKVNEALRILAELNLPDSPEVRCPDCGLAFRGPLTLSEHLYHSHGGPEPQVWAALEAKIAAPRADVPERAGLGS